MRGHHEDELQLTEWRGALLAAAVIRVQLGRPDIELVLSADLAREMATRLVRLAEVADGVDYRTWKTRQGRLG